MYQCRSTAAGAIRTLREGWDKHAISEALGVSEQSIDRWEEICNTEGCVNPLIHGIYSLSVARPCARELLQHHLPRRLVQPAFVPVRLPSAPNQRPTSHSQKRTCHSTPCPFMFCA
ncbi:hypothetical protein FIBSPDRAFT_851099 [Athelia psychrophila]|uniref:Uncharacterized protein n=1 Tax=Athelia psychrophila TaxID=1759441 RepID=A0A166SX68_9AGAM|nr:hypothetical protein FIBSPDRAFT_851099 [Fibularhizoctonia sp. CBS 109695]